MAIYFEEEYASNKSGEWALTRIQSGHRRLVNASANWLERGFLGSLFIELGTEVCRNNLALGLELSHLDLVVVTCGYTNSAEIVIWPAPTSTLTKA